MIGEEIDRPLGHKGCDRRVENRLQQADPADFAAFRDYLEGVLKKEAVSFALNMEAPPTRMTAVLAVDERLTYAHIRPFLYTLASVGITQYGFETKIH